MKYLKTIFISISILVLLFFVLFVFNQTVQVVQLAGSLSPLLGKVVLWALLLIYLILAVIPVVLYFRLPGALKPPESDQSPEFQEYLTKLSKRLQKNVYLKDRTVENREEVEQALKALDKEADAVIKKNATAVFITTAISQSGRLDAFTVLLAQVRMVWQVATIYNQRPSLREMGQLYANVAATTFVASELDDLDISQQVEPIIGSVLSGSLTSALPGVQTVSVIITNSLITGAANAYLTLRVGAISKQYCGSLVRSERKIVRKFATLEATKMLSTIVMSSAGNIYKAMFEVAVRRPGKFSRDVIRNAWEKLAGKGKEQDKIKPEA